MMRAGYLPFVMAFVVAPTLQAGAQNLPWPGNAPTAAPQSQAAASPPTSPAPMTAPTPMMGSPMMGAPMGAPPGGMGGGGMGGGGMGGMGGGGSPPPCVTEFSKMREDVQKKGIAAKQASEKHVTREELCKLITVYSSAEGQWLKFTEKGVSACGIPVEIVNQLKQVHGRTEMAREKICAAGPATASMAPPSLSEALGTSRPTLETKRAAGSSMFDTLTGNPIQK
jgi:hypothetical protein